MSGGASLVTLSFMSETKEASRDSCRRLAEADSCSRDRETLRCGRIVSLAPSGTGRGGRGSSTCFQCKGRGTKQEEEEEEEEKKKSGKGSWKLQKQDRACQNDVANLAKVLDWARQVLRVEFGCVPAVKCSLEQERLLALAHLHMSRKE